MLGLVKTLVIYGLTFAFFIGTPFAGVLQILYPITASGVSVSSTYVAFINVTSPITIPLLAFSVENGSASLTLINSTAMVFEAASSNGINITIWSVPSPYTILVNSTPITSVPNATYIYDPLYQKLTILLYGAFNSTSIAIVFAPIATSTPSIGSLSVTVGVTLSSVTKIYPNRAAQAAVDALIAITLTIAPIAYLVTRGLGRMCLLISVVSAILAALCLVVRADIVDYIYIANGVKKYVYMVNPWGYIYTAPLVASIGIALINVIDMIRRAFARV